MEENQKEVVNDQSQMQIIEQKPLPISLHLLIENSNKTLQDTQQRLLDDVTRAATELMVLMQLNPHDGWMLDLQGMRFIKIQGAKVEE